MAAAAETASPSPPPSPGLPPHRAEAAVGATAALTWLAATNVAAVLVAALYFGRAIFVPFALAVLLSFALAPAVRALRRARLGRTPSVVLVVAFAFALIFGLGAIVADQVGTLAARLPEYQSNIQAKIRSLNGAKSGGVVERASNVLRNLGEEIAQAADSGLAGAAGRRPTGELPAKPVPVEIRQPDPGPLQLIQSVLSPLLAPLATTGVVIVFVVFILLQREDLRDKLIRLAGAGDLHRTTEALNDAAARVSRYLLTQSVINAAFGLTVRGGLFVVGVPNAPLWGLLAALLRFIPYLGWPIAAAFPAALALAVDPGWGMLLWTIGMFFAASLVCSQILEPLLFGVSTGLSPIAVLVSALFWTWLWGPVGLLLSTPLTVCLLVLGRHVPRLEFLSVLVGNERVLAPEERFYQRLLAGDPEAALDQIDEHGVATKSLPEFFDGVVAPALALAQQDSDRGALDSERRAGVRDSLLRVLANLREDETPPAGAGARVLCVAGRNELDEAAAAVLAEILRRRGILARALPAAVVSPDNVALLDPSGIEAVCLSYVSAGSEARARRFVARLRRRCPRAAILVGVWNVGAAATTSGEVFAAANADGAASSLSAAVRWIEDRLAHAAPAVASAEPASSPRDVAAE